MRPFVLFLREKLQTDVFNDSDLVHLIDGSANRRYGLVKRAISAGDIVQLRRGVYCFNKILQRTPLNTFSVAQKIYFPSYISTESALSFHGLIPEAVYTTTSMTLRRSTFFETAIGNFSFSHLPKFSFFGVDRIQDGKEFYLMASPARAIADLIVVGKLDLNPLELKESLRIADEDWQNITFALIAQLAEHTRNLRLRLFVKHLEKLDIA